MGGVSFTKSDGRGSNSIVVRERRAGRRVVETRSDGISESLLFFGLDSVVVAVLVVVATAGIVYEVERFPIEVGGERVMSHLGVDHGGAFESVDDRGKVGEEPGADGEGLFELSVMGEIDGGVGELGEAIVVEREQRLEGSRNVSECGHLDSVSWLGGFALLGGQCLVKGQTALLVFFAAVAGARVVSSNRGHKVHHGRAAARCLGSCRTTGDWGRRFGSS